MLACGELSVVWSHLYRHIAGTQPAQTFRWYRINRRGPNTLPRGTPEAIGIHSLVAPSATTLPTVGEELGTNEQHTANYTNRFQFE